MLASSLLSPPARPTSVTPLAREFFCPPPGRQWQVSGVANAVGRCLALSLLACLLTRPLVRPSHPAPAPHVTGAPVSVTADISRRLAAADSGFGHAGEDAVLWAGVE